MCNMFPSCPIAQHPPLPLHPPSSPFSISRAIDCEVAGGDRDDIRNKLSAGGRRPAHIGHDILLFAVHIYILLLCWPCSVVSKRNTKKNLCIDRYVKLNCQHSPKYMQEYHAKLIEVWFLKYMKIWTTMAITCMKIYVHILQYIH